MLLKDQERGASHSWEAPFTADLTTATILIVVNERNGFFTMVAIDQIDTPENPYQTIEHRGSIENTKTATIVVRTHIS